MARKKVTLAWIVNGATRRRTMSKRSKGLIKKVGELSTLCGVEACAVIYAPGEARPEVWPSEMNAETTLLKYQAMPETEQCKKRLDQAGFLGQGVAKLQDQIWKKRGENWEIGLKTLFDEILDGKRSYMDLEKVEDTMAMDRILCEKINELKQKIAAMKAKETASIFNHNPNGVMELWNGVAMMRTTAPSNPSNRTIANSNPNTIGGMELGFLNGVAAMQMETRPLDRIPNLGESMETGFCNGVTVIKTSTSSLEPSSDIVHNPRNLHEGMGLGLRNGVAKVKTEATTSNPVHNPKSNPSLLSDMEFGFWSGDGQYQGSQEFEAMMQGTSSSWVPGTSSSWVDMSIFKDCHF